MTGDSGVDEGRFGVGDRVSVLVDRPGGNPRTPAYARGRVGEVVQVRGVVDNPIDHLDPYPPLYTVRFLFEGSSDELYLDLHDEWLAPADGAASS
jgi:hypothetical protein